MTENSYRPELQGEKSPLLTGLMEPGLKEEEEQKAIDDSIELIDTDDNTQPPE